MRIFIKLFCLLFFLLLFYTNDALADKVDPTFLHQRSPFGDAPITRVSGPYGETSGHHGAVHHGIDITSTKDEAPVYAVASGRVELSEDGGGFIHWVWIDHGGGYWTVYGDLDYRPQYVPVHAGDYVQQGQLIGYTYPSSYGSDSNGAHLHFEEGTGFPNRFGNFLRPSEYQIWADWLPRDAEVGVTLNTSGGTGGFQNVAKRIAIAFNATADFVKPLKETADKFIKACVDGQEPVANLGRLVLILLMTIDFSLSAILAAIDKEAWSGTGAFVKWLTVKLFFYAFLGLLIMHWGAIIADTVKNLFLDMGAATSGLSIKDAAKAVTDPLGLVAKGASLAAPIFPYISEEDAMTTNFLASLVRAAFALVCAIIIIGSFTLIALQILYAYLEFYAASLMGLSTLMFAGFKHTRDLAQKGIGGFIVSGARLFFWIIFAAFLEGTLTGMTVDGLVSAGGTATYVSAHPDGNFTSVDDIAAAIAVVESGGNYDVYNEHKPRNGTAAFGKYQQIPEFWDERVEAYAKEQGISLENMYAMSLENDPPDSPRAYGVTHYGWNPQLQEGVTKSMMEGYLRESPGDYRYICTRWLGTSSDEYWQKVCNAAGMSRSTPTLNPVVALKIILVCLMFVLMGGRICDSILKSLSAGEGFYFIAPK